MRRSLIILMFLSLSAAPLMAGPGPEQILKTVLELDDQQLVELQSLMEARHTALSDVAARIDVVRRQLEAALAAANPDPAAVGALVISIRGLEREAAQQQESTRASFMGILNDEQRQRVESFRFIRAAFAGGTALDELGL